MVEFRLVTEGLVGEIESLLSRGALRVYLVSAFVTYHGAERLVDWVSRHPSTDFRLVTGTYLDFTDPDGLHLLRVSGVNFRVLDKRLESLHAKAYLFEFGGSSVLIIGSANLTRSALSGNIEWSGHISEGDPHAFEDFLREFEGLWGSGQLITDEWLQRYRHDYRVSNAFLLSRDDSERERPTPRAAQAEALASLEELRRRGETKGLVVMATGLGKTHLAAFDSMRYSRVLFIAHRKEILLQARRVFESVRGGGECLLFEDGWWTKDRADVLFATVQKLGRVKTLEKFSPTDFNYIVVDEFHHARASQYSRILEYFDPMFLLGLTATPFRMDRQDITSLCDYQLPYTVTFMEAIERGWLSPFHYYGIYDADLDYSAIPWKRRRYDVRALEGAASTEVRASKILERYIDLGSSPAVAFCISIAHADYMCDFFSAHGVPSLAVHSRGATPGEGKKRVLSGEVEVIFAVDVFNEGVDLPEISTVMFLRPTESLTIFIQQFGRGLRLSSGKSQLTVLDFVGNYKKSFTVPVLLLGSIYPHLTPECYNFYIRHIAEGTVSLPEGCEITLDLKLVDIMREGLGLLHPVKNALIEEYMGLKNLLGEVPLLTLASHAVSIWNYVHTFGSLYDFYRGVGDLNEDQQGYSRADIDVLRWIERKDFKSEIALRVLQAIFTEEYLDLEDVEEMMYSVDLSELSSSSVTEIFDEWTSPTKFGAKKIGPGISRDGSHIMRSPEVNWHVLRDDIVDRIELRIRYVRKSFVRFENYTTEEIIRILQRRYPEGKFRRRLETRREGILRFDGQELMLLFVTLDKDPRGDVTTMYKDHLISEDVFEWESQNRTTLESKDGRVITGELNYEILLFIRLRERDKVYGNSHFYFGRVRCIEHEGEKPIRVLWKLEEEVPTDLYTLLTEVKYRKYKVPKQSDFDLDAEI